MDILTALQHHQAGRLTEAVAAYLSILETTPDHPDALHLMGRASLQLGDAALAETLIARAVALAPDHAGYLASLGNTYRQMGQAERAFDCYRRVLAQEPASAAAHFGIANLLMQQQRMQEAEQSFLAALAAQPEFFEARFNLANLQKAEGRYEEAIVNYREAVRSQPAFADAYHNLGSALSALGRDVEALESYRNALTGNFPETWNNIANIQLRRGHVEEALAHYRQAVELKPDYAEAWNNLGNALRDARRWNDAVLCYETAVKIAPEMADAQFNLGVGRRLQGRLEEALDCFNRALAQRPNDADTLYNVAYVHMRLGRLELAEQGYRDTLAQHPAYLDAHINLSAILIEGGRREEARQHIDFAYARQNLFERRSPEADKTILLLFDAGKGNMNLSYLFNAASNNLLDWMIEYGSEEQMAALPAHDIVFNAMGDADLTGAVAAPLQRFLSRNRKPLLNPPDKVARTARHLLPRLLEGIAGTLIPPLWRFADGEAWNEAAAGMLPLLVRPVYTQGGEGMEKIETAQAKAALRAAQRDPMYVSRYEDYQSADGYYRKYRVIFIDRQPYPYHLAISPQWMVHYYTADMEAHAWKLDEEKRFLSAPEAVLGAAGMAALHEIGRRLDLDYAGIDFSLARDGRILVFEANPTMLVHPEPEPGPLQHKNVYVRRILDAFETLLQRSAFN